MRFEELTPGDRFKAHGSLWTKLDATTARRHSDVSILLGTNGYSCIDPSCSFSANDEVAFAAVDASHASVERTKLPPENMIVQTNLGEHYQHGGIWFKWWPDTGRSSITGIKNQSGITSWKAISPVQYAR